MHFTISYSRSLCICFLFYFLPVVKLLKVLAEIYEDTEKYRKEN